MTFHKNLSLGLLLVIAVCDLVFIEINIPMIRVVSRPLVDLVLVYFYGSRVSKFKPLILLALLLSSYGVLTQFEAYNNVFFYLGILIPSLSFFVYTYLIFKKIKTHLLPSYFLGFILFGSYCFVIFQDIYSLLVFEVFIEIIHAIVILFFCTISFVFFINHPKKDRLPIFLGAICFLLSNLFSAYKYFYFDDSFYNLESEILYILGVVMVIYFFSKSNEQPTPVEV